MKKNYRSYIFLFVIAGIIIALDQWTKMLVRSNLSLGESWSPWFWLYPYARIVHWYNTGVAFGLFQQSGSLFKILPIIISGVIIYYYPRVPLKDWALRIALAMQLGGAIGNLIDRLTIGHVTDFISIGSFPVWNVADASITVGVAVLLLGIWLQERKERQAANLAEQNELPEEQPGKQETLP